MVDCSVHLEHELVEGVSYRSFRVVKLRGSAFDENSAPMVIGGNGIEVASSRWGQHSPSPSTTERISTGVERLDTMLEGGYYRGTSILLTGSPGTAKSTLAGAFCLAACERGEQSILVSFDSRADDIVRNLASVNLPLARHVESGCCGSLRSCPCKAARSGTF